MTVPRNLMPLLAASALGMRMGINYVIYAMTH
jgi:hypothetical protein